jgi:hypothetical protein
MAKRKPNRARGKDGQHDWSKQMRFDVEYAKDALFNRAGVSPMFVIHTDDRIIPCPTDMRDKERIRKILRLLCMAHRAIGVVFIGEAWATRGLSPDEQMRPGESWADWDARMVPPSESDRRYEVVLVQSMFYDEAGEKRGLAEMLEIERGDDGKPSGLKPPTEHDHRVKPDNEMQGPTFDILPEQRASSYDAEIAQQVLDALGIKLANLPNIT